MTRALNAGTSIGISLSHHFLLMTFQGCPRRIQGRVHNSLELWPVPVELLQLRATFFAL